MRLPLCFDATIERADFLRLLPVATGDTFREDGDWLRSERWSIRLTPLPRLAIGAVSLVRHRVEIELSGMSAMEEGAFMDRFSLAYQRGGG